MIVIVDYNAGNLTSVKRALDYLGIPSTITPDPARITSAERVIFPGVGNAVSAMETLTRLGIDAALKKVYQKGTPLLGICLGTQIILSHSDEGDTKCLGLIEGNCSLFKLNDPLLKVPHMGWNSLSVRKEHYILKDLKEGDEFYFVHSYYPVPDSTGMVYADCGYEIDFPAAIGNGSLFATQFHPEKSGRAGLKMLKNFAAWDGSSC